MLYSEGSVASYLCNALSMLVALTLPAIQMVSQPVLRMPTEHSWGVVVPDGGSSVVPAVTTTVTLVNKGTQELVIKEVRPNCGCTTAPLDAQVIAVGDSTHMHITMKLPAGNGMVTKFVTVVTNEPTDSIHALKLMANVERPLQLSSAYIPFNETTVGKETEGRLTITSYVKAPTLVSFQTTTPDTVIEPTTATLKQGVPETLLVKHTPKIKGTLDVSITLKCPVVGYENINIIGVGVVR
jgi:hypothetical protein